MSEEEETKAEAVDGESIRTKLVHTLRANKTLVQQSTFTWLEIETEQLQSLRTAEPYAPDISHDNIYFGAEVEKLMRYDIIVHNNFLGLACSPKKFYAREGYDELFDYVCKQWKSDDCFHVVLLGNAGTGKSWFQVHALKRLMSAEKDEKEFDFVIRQVASTFYLIDLDEAKVYLWDISPQHVGVLSNAMKKTLYFFEPGKDANATPTDVFIPSLLTLSPNIPRIKEYGKDLCMILYFWPWSSGELWAVIEDSKLSISNKVFEDRYHKFGGIVRHILNQDRQAEEKLRERLGDIKLNVLTSISLNIDRTTEGQNVSGFLICYDNRPIKDSDRSAEKNLKFTSECVKEQVQYRIGNVAPKTIMQNVLDRLSGRKIDISGKNLERATMVLLSRGREFQWVKKEIGANEVNWQRFVASTRTIVREFALTDHFCQAGAILAPHNMTFPAVDFVFSQPFPLHPVVAFQCTWALRHDVNVKALCKLRKRHMRITDERMLEIYMVCPGKENAYVSRNKDAFLVNKPTRAFKLDGKTVSLCQIERMLVNTKLFVIRPKENWHDQVTAYISNHH